MTRVVLVRHTNSVPDAGVTADLWDVTGTGRQRAAMLVPAMRDLGVDLVVTSPERKAVITGDILAQGLGTRRIEMPDLSEQSWSRVPFLAAQEDFVATVRDHFARPDEMVFGEESSRAAGERFDRVVQEVLALPGPPRIPAFVSHGRIMSAWIALLIGEDAFTFWQDLRMPDAFRVDVEQRTWERVSSGV